GLDAVQLWVALPEGARSGHASFEHDENLPSVTLPARTGPDARAVVFMGAFAGVASAATTFTPLVGVQLDLAAGSTVDVPLAATWEYGVLLAHGDLAVGTDHVAPDDL